MPGRAGGLDGSRGGGLDLALQSELRAHNCQGGPDVGAYLPLDLSPFSFSLSEGLPVFTCFSKNESDLALSFRNFTSGLLPYLFYPRTPACVSGERGCGTRSCARVSGVWLQGNRQSRYSALMRALSWAARETRPPSHSAPWIAPLPPGLNLQAPS